MEPWQTDDNRRVVVTGLGVVSSIGIGHEFFAQALREGRSGASPIASFDTGKFPSHIGCEVQGFATVLPPGPGCRDGYGRSSLMAIAAARQAVADAGFLHPEETLVDCDVVMGTTDGESGLFDALALAMLRDPDAGPESLPMLRTAECIADAVQAELGLKGDSVVLATACSAGNYAIGYAFDKIRSLTAQFVLCGGSDSQCLKNFGGFYRIGGLAPERCQPFDQNRKGILPGEGAGVLMLESLASARARGAVIHAEILGYGTGCDGVHIMAPDQAGIAACARDALDRAGIKPDSVDYICAHGTGTPMNDTIETAAMREVFGNRLPPMSSIKSMIGHTMGAASALAAIACVLSLKQGFLPPTINMVDPDPQGPEDCVANQSRICNLEIVQNNAFAFGGNNAIVLFRKWREPV